MGVSGNSIAAKSFMSFMVNEGLLSKTVEAIKAGEKEARSSSTVQSFEVFYRGFRQNIAIGRIYIVPPSVADKKGQDFPTALLYGCLVRTFGGEEMGDMISHKIGDTEWDEYSQASYDTIKEELFGTEGGKFASLILFAPNWVNKREYVGFQFPKDDNQLANLTRHLVFSSYFDPRLSSCFDALMTNVETSKLDVTDITPKMNFPALAENPLKEFPLLTKQGTQKRTRLGLTIKTADEVTKAVLEPEEMNVFESLDTALRNSLTPSDTKGVEDASEGKAPQKGEMVPRLSSKEAEYQPKTGQPCSCRKGVQRDNCPQCEGTGQRIDFAAIRKQNGPKKGSATAVFEVPFTNVGPGTAAHDEANQGAKGYKDEKDVPKPIINSAPIGIALDETGVPRRPEEERKEKSATTKTAHGFIAFYGGKRIEIQADSLYAAKLKAIEMLKVPKSKQGLLAVELAEKDGEQVTTTITSSAKIAHKHECPECHKSLTCNNPKDCPGEGKKALCGSCPKKASAAEAAKRMQGIIPTMDIRPGINAGSDLSGKKMDRFRHGGYVEREHPAEIKAFCAGMGTDKQADQALADHAKQVQAGGYGDKPLEKSAAGNSPDPDKMKTQINKSVGQSRQGQDAVKDHNASFDAAKWGGLGKKQASSLWVGSAKKVAEGMDQFTRGYIETALWSSNDESDPSGGNPLDQNYDIRDLSPSCLQAMTEDCAGFQDENRDLLDAASTQDSQDEFRQGHDFWLTRCGHGAGYWDGDYPTTGDGLTEAAKHWGNVDLYVGDDDMIYQYGSEDLKPGWQGQRHMPGKDPYTDPHYEQASSKKASKKTASQNDASYIASLISGSHSEDYDARSQHSKTAAQKREEEMDRKYSSQRKKFHTADVATDIDDIWAETMEEMGPAPEVDIPGEENPTHAEADVPAEMKSNEPEVTKGDQESSTAEVEESLENNATESEEPKSEEPKPSTDEGGAVADSKETKSESGSKSEWAKNRSKGKSEENKKKEEPKEETEGESKEASVDEVAQKLADEFAEDDIPEGRQRVSCNQCEMLSIQGTPCHETGCPNQGARWDADMQDWVKQRECIDCGFTVDADDPCCSAPWTRTMYEESDGEVEFEQEASMQVDAAFGTEQAVFYECGSCGGVHPSMATSEKLGLGWSGDCRDESGQLDPNDIPNDDSTLFISMEEQMSPNFDDSILASGEPKTADQGEPEDWIGRECDCGNSYSTTCPIHGDWRNKQESCKQCGRPMSLEMDSEGVSHHITDLGEIDYDTDADHVAVTDDDDMNYFASEEKTADTADNPANEADGSGAIEVKTDHDVAKTAAAKRIKRIPSHVGLSRYLHTLQDTGEGIPRMKDIPSPYAYSPEHMTYLTPDGREVFIVETSHKIYDVFEVPQGTPKHPYDQGFAEEGVGMTGENDEGKCKGCGDPLNNADGAYCVDMLTASDERSDDVPVAQGETVSNGQPKSDLSGGAPEAHDLPPQVDDKTACAGYGDEEDEERSFDLGLGDLADLVVEKEDAH